MFFSIEKSCNRFNCNNINESPQVSQKPQQQAFQRKRKPQIISIPGIPLKEKHRWRVVLGGQKIGDHLSLEQAAELAGLKLKGVES